MIALTRDRIDAEKLVAAAKRGEDGAVVVFDGIVRNNTRGRQTLYLDYEAYEEMALRQMNELAEQARSEFGVRQVTLVHRLGRLELGETSVLIVVASAHRGAAFEACRWVIDTLKKTVPIWKKETFVDGTVWAEASRFPRSWLWIRRRGMRGENRRRLGCKAVFHPGDDGDFADSHVGQTTTLHVDVKLVSLFVNVTDRNGAIVGGLTREDFKVTEDGRPQQIAVFERQSEMPLNLMLAIDTSGSVKKDLTEEAEAARRFAHAIVRPQDQMAVLQFATEVRELTPFTNKMSQIDRGLGQLRGDFATALYDAISGGRNAWARRRGGRCW